MAKNGISAKQKRAIAALLTTRDARAAAKQANVGERTLYRWLAEDDAFKRALSKAEGRAIDAAARRLISLQGTAIDTLKNVLDDAEASATVRLRAAQAVLDYLLKLRELRNIEQRLTALEEAIANER
jgi:hypothetical protein